jgi:hypothetical protein
MLGEYLAARTGALSGQASHAAENFVKAARRGFRRNSKAPLAILAGVGTGAALMYLFDPQQGSRRRSAIRERAVSAGQTIGDRSRSAWSTIRDRSSGLYDRAHGLVRSEPLADDTLSSRIRSKLDRLTSHSQSIDVSVNQGKVLLSGSALASEIDRLVRKIGRIRGVQAVEHQLLQLQDEVSSNPTLRRLGAQAQDLRLRAGETLGEWSPATRVAAGAAGSTLIAGAFFKRGPIGAALGAIGVGLIAAGALALSKREESDFAESDASSDTQSRALSEAESSPA